MTRPAAPRDRHPALQGSGGGPRRARARVARSLAALALVGTLVSPAVVAAGSSEQRPNDRMYEDQWALENTGQMVNWTEGTPGADINAPKAWGLTTGSESIVIAVIDGKFNVKAEDLTGNVWENPGGVGGCSDGHGYHVPTKACDPQGSKTEHGTRMGYIMGAVGNNEKGLSGVNWTTSIMGVTLDTERNASTVEKAIEWIVDAKQDGADVRVINASWGGWFDDDPAVEDTIATAGDHGILYVAGAGNTGDDLDKQPDYPCSYELSNVVCVAASDQHDELWNRSSYGAKTVDLAAPGANICNWPGDDCSGDGTSYSTAFVSGAATLILAHQPSLSVSQLKARILDNVRPVDALEGKVATGGVLDVYCAMTNCRADSNSPSSSSSTSSTTTTTSGSGSSSSTTTTTSGSSSTEPGDDGSSGTEGSDGGTGSGTTSGGGSTGDSSGTSDGSGSSTDGSSSGAFWDPTTSGDSGGEGGDSDGGDLSLVTGSDTNGSTGNTAGTGGGTSSDAGGTGTPGTAGGGSNSTQATDDESGSSKMPRQPLAVDRPSADDEAGSPWSATTVTALVAIIFLALAARMLYVEATRRLSRHR